MRKEHIIQTYTLLVSSKNFQTSQVNVGQSAGRIDKCQPPCIPT